MAIKPKIVYAGQIDETDSTGYPHGKAQNDIVEGDGFGTPLEQTWLNDLFGMQQALLLAADITPSGTPDTATASQYLQSFYRLLGRVDGWGALGNDSADDTGAILAALTALALRTGRQELHLVPGRIYRVTGLNVPPNVDIVGHNGQLSNSHASNDLLTYDDASSDRKPARIREVIFSASTTGTGTALKITGGLNVSCYDCHFGASSGATGRFVYITSTAKVDLTKCIFEGRGDVPQVESKSRELRINDCRFFVPLTYSASVIKLDASVTCQTFMSGVLFDTRDHDSGSSTYACVEIVNALARLTMDNTVYYGAGPSSADVICLKWGSVVARVNETNTTRTDGMLPYSGTVVLAEGSSLDLRPHGSEVTALTTYPFPDDYRSFSLKADIASLPITLLMPKKRFPGQEYDLVMYSANTGTDWADGQVTLDALGPDMLSAQDVSVHLAMKTGRFRLVRDHFADTWNWMLIGDWVPMFNRAHTIEA